MKTEFLRLVSLGVMVWVGPFAWSQPAQPESRKPGEKRTVTLPGGVKMEFAWCPPGSFLMGSPPTETGRHESETQHQVDITKGYWLGVHEVTQAQWSAVVGDNPSKFRGYDLPVESVSWFDAQKFCEELRKKVGIEARLPTEAEWEYACRAGNKSVYGYGDDASGLENYAWFADNSGVKKIDSLKELQKCNHDFNEYLKILSNNGCKTCSIAKKKPNNWGFYDLHGNVGEWCSDWYEVLPGGKETDPTGPPIGSVKIIRSACWSGCGQHLRSAARFATDPEKRSNDLGFRLAVNASAFK